MVLILDVAKLSSVSAAQWSGLKRRVAVRRTRGRVPGSKWSCLLLRIVLQDALSEAVNICLPLKLRVFVDDITALVMGRNKEVAEMAKKVDEEVQRRILTQRASNCQFLRMARKERAR